MITSSIKVCSINYEYTLYFEHTQAHLFFPFMLLSGKGLKWKGIVEDIPNLEKSFKNLNIHIQKAKTP